MHKQTSPSPLTIRTRKKTMQVIPAAGASLKCTIIPARGFLLSVCFPSNFLAHFQFLSPQERALSKFWIHSLIFIKQNFEPIILLLKKLCWFLISSKAISGQLTGIQVPPQFGLNLSSLPTWLTFAYARPLSVSWTWYTPTSTPHLRPLHAP